MPLAAMLASLAASLDPQRGLVVHALGHDLQAPVWDRLTRSLPEGRARWNRIDVDTTGLRTEGFGTRAYDHISPVCYFRLLLPELLPSGVEKVLYLDCDLIIRDDLSSLWETDVSATAFAAAHELDSPAVKARLVDGVRFHRELGLTRDRARFNSGVLVLNLAQWRRSHGTAGIHLPACAGHRCSLGTSRKRSTWLPKTNIANSIHVGTCRHSGPRSGLMTMSPSSTT